MAQNVKPTILIIHGAWHQAAHFDGFINLLQRRGYEVECPTLPSSNNAVPPNKSLPDDVKLVRDTATALVTDGKEIVVLMHSYGGIVGTDALYDLSLDVRRENGLNGGIKRLLYMCALLPHSGQSLSAIFGGATASYVEVKDGLLLIDNPEALLYNDVAPELAKKAASLLVVHPAAAQGVPTSHEAFRDIPVTYLLCENDQGLPVEFQKIMCERIEALGVKVDYETCSAGHSPFLSMPDELANILDRVVNK